MGYLLPGMGQNCGMVCDEGIGLVTIAIISVSVLG
jgi:hypothetical protein